MWMEGGISRRGAVGIFGRESGDSALNSTTFAVCVLTDDEVVHRVLLKRTAASPGDKARL